jgi:hypothetical protein
MFRGSCDWLSASARSLRAELAFKEAQGHQWTHERFRHCLGYSQVWTFASETLAVTFRVQTFLYGRMSLYLLTVSGPDILQFS